MNPRIIVVSLGTGDPDLLNAKTISALRTPVPLILRTGIHPIVSWLEENGITFSTLDRFYEESDDFDQLNQNIADYLIGQASVSEIIYAVTDAVTDQTVRYLLQNKPRNLSVTVIPGISYYDIHLASSISFLNNSSVLAVPAAELTDHFHYNPNITLLVTELDNEIQAGQIKLILSDFLDDEKEIWLIRTVGNPVKLFLWQLDRQSGINHHCAVLIPGSGMLERSRFVLNDLTTLMDILRSPSGCPWDRIQTHHSLRPFMIEEAWECVASIDQQDMDHLSEELGDLLFQVVFHSSIGKSFDEFTINDVISRICLKMIRRHPHVFGSGKATDADSVRSEWEKIKQRETGHISVVSSLDDVSSGLPSLKYAAKIFKKLNGTCAVRSDPALILNDIHILVSELLADPDQACDENLGRLLLLCSELCYAKEADSELILHNAAEHFKLRLRSVENALIRDGKSLEHLTFEELGVYLNHVEGEIE